MPVARSIVAMSSPERMSAPEQSIDSLRRSLGARYGIERLLGKGGMGAVYLARDLQLDRPVALKVLPPEFAQVPDLRERFLRETRMAASFSHPNIVPVFSVEDRDGLLAFAMGYVEGESLTQRVERSGPLSVREIVKLLQDVGYALAYAHGRGVVHRDIKPDNIMIERATGRALLMDFGISRTITTQTTAQGLTRVGEVVGTPEFMSPEQAAGDTLTGTSDLYSLGLVAWFAATGNLAISGDSTQKIIVRQITETIPPIGAQRSDLPTALSDTIDRCLRKDPAERFASAEELVDTLDAARLAGPEVPLPIRLFAEETGTSGLVLLGSLVMGWLLFELLQKWYSGDLDVIMPMVLFGTIVWSRVTQTPQMAGRLARRGFTVDEIQQGLARVLDERDADRAQLRADPALVARRRRQIAILVGMLVLAWVLNWYALNYQRVETRPGYYGVKRLGVYLFYATNVMRGIAIVGLVRSPLRRPVGEWLLRWFWLGPAGRMVLRWSARGVPVSAGAGRSTTTGAVIPPGMRVTPRIPTAVPNLPASTEASLADRVAQLESRVNALERR